MNHKPSHQYDDMSPDSKVQEEDRRFRTMKRMVTAITLMLILAAAAAIVYIIMTSSEFGAASSEPIDLTRISIAPAEDPELLEPVGSAGTPADPVESQNAESSSRPEQEPAAVPPAAEEPAVQTPETEEPLSAEQVPDDVEQETAAAVQAPARSGTGVNTNPVSFFSYTVQPGDTISKIADANGLRPETIIGVNEITNIDEIRSGSVLEIPDRDGQMYTVRKGDSLSVIAYEYDMGYVTLAEVNGLKSQLIIIGQKLFIPEKTISTEDYQIVMKSFFVRPAQGPLRYGFGDEVEDIITGEKSAASGIYISGELGSPVVASNTGTVVGVHNDQSGKGRYIVLDHDNGYVSVYGHVDAILVEVGVSVQQADQIATIGNTGAILEPMLYFSIEKDGSPVDPEEFF